MEQLIEYKEMREAIARVRELAESLADYDWHINEMDKSYTGKVVSMLILKALDGE